MGSHLANNKNPEYSVESAKIMNIEVTQTW